MAYAPGFLVPRPRAVPVRQLSAPRRPAASTPAALTHRTLTIGAGGFQISGAGAASGSRCLREPPGYASRLEPSPWPRQELWGSPQPRARGQLPMAPMLNGSSDTRSLDSAIQGPWASSAASPRAPGRGCGLPSWPSPMGLASHAQKPGCYSWVPIMASQLGKQVAEAEPNVREDGHSASASLSVSRAARPGQSNKGEHMPEESFSSKVSTAPFTEPPQQSQDDAANPSAPETARGPASARSPLAHERTPRASDANLLSLTSSRRLSMSVPHLAQDATPRGPRDTPLCTPRDGPLDPRSPSLGNPPNRPVAGGFSPRVIRVAPPQTGPSNHVSTSRLASPRVPGTGLSFTPAPLPPHPSGPPPVPPGLAGNLSPAPSLAPPLQGFETRSVVGPASPAPCLSPPVLAPAPLMPLLPLVPSPRHAGIFSPKISAHTGMALAAPVVSWAKPAAHPAAAEQRELKVPLQPLPHDQPRLNRLSQSKLSQVQPQPQPGQESKSRQHLKEQLLLKDKQHLRQQQQEHRQRQRQQQNVPPPDTQNSEQFSRLRKLQMEDRSPRYHRSANAVIHAQALCPNGKEAPPPGDAEGHWEASGGREEFIYTI